MVAGELLNDIRWGLRGLRRERGFTTVVVATLALGIAANTLVFSVINPYLFRELPFGDADRLVQLGHVDTVNGWDSARFSLPQLHDYRRETSSFEGLAAYYYTAMNVSGEGPPRRVEVGVLTPNMFEVLDATVARGRTFGAGDGTEAADRVVVLGDGPWRNLFGADPAIVGRSIRLDGVPHTVLGVMPPRFNFPYGSVRLWVPMDEHAPEPRGRHGKLIVGRLAAGVDAGAAERELDALQARFAAAYPTADGRFTGISVKPLREALNFAWSILRLSFVVLVGAVAAVLLLACVNVANLVLARASGRARELAVRSALGAGRGRLVRQLLVEGLMLALAGGTLGVLLASAGGRWLGPYIPVDLYRVGDFTLDPGVLVVSALVTLGTPLVFALIPALLLVRGNLTTTLAEGGRGGSAGRGALRLRRGLVIAEVAVALALTCAAGLMLRSFLSLQQVDLGFDAERLVSADIILPNERYGDAQARDAFFDRASTVVGALPGIQAAATVSRLPLNHENIPTQVAVPGREPAAAEAWPVVLRSLASPGYFATMGLRVEAGRDLAAGDRYGVDNESVVISRRLAELLWPGEDPIGRALRFGDPAAPATATVVGVVSDLIHAAIDRPPRPHLYRPLAGSATTRRFLVARVGGGRPAAATAGLRGALATIDPDVAAEPRPMLEVVAENTLQWRLISSFLGAFGVVAALLAALGIYGVIAYAVARRRRELGIRMALGATAAAVRRLVLAEGVRLAAVGVGVGLIVALAAGRLMRAVLYDVGAADPLTLVASLLLFVALSAGASVAPARRAARLDPGDVLRDD